jgi:hypothetical protein
LSLIRRHGRSAEPALRGAAHLGVAILKGAKGAKGVKGAKVRMTPPAPPREHENRVLTRSPHALAEACGPSWMPLVSGSQRNLGHHASVSSLQFQDSAGDLGFLQSRVEVCTRVGIRIPDAVASRTRMPWVAANARGYRLPQLETRNLKLETYHTTRPGIRRRTSSLDQEQRARGVGTSAGVDEDSSVGYGVGDAVTVGSGVAVLVRAGVAVGVSCLGRDRSSSQPQARGIPR